MRAALFATAFLVPMLAACLIGHDDHSNGNNSSPDPQNDQPLVVSIDTNQTMSHVAGGSGVGLFVQYAAGGHWKVRWTCDTSLSGLSCDFAVKMSGTAIANGKSTFDPSESGDTMRSPTPDEIDLTSHTTVAVDELDFDAAPGADLKIDLSVSGLRDGSFFFFVQNGQIDGNFPTSKLSDPLVFEPSAP
ncbi:MAG TPA: hypothetical protein VGH28_32880 [Polyangiaceae bacterium]|jgi:hypothetical protein